MTSKFFYSLLALIFISCSSKEVQTINLDDKPKEQIVLKKNKIKRTFKGTLYSREGTSLFADKKDLKIGDILQVIISETLNNSSRNTKDLSKTNTSELGGGVLSPASGVVNTIGTAARLNKINNIIGVGVNTNSSNKFKGSASSRYDEKFSTTVSVVIAEVYQNGNYFINGNKVLLIDNQKQKIAISGIIRPYDISPTNTVSSSQIANLKILYKKDGDDVNSIRKPWGSKILENLWPF